MVENGWWWLEIGDDVSKFRVVVTGSSLVDALTGGGVLKLGSAGLWVVVGASLSGRISLVLKPKNIYRISKKTYRGKKQLTYGPRDDDIVSWAIFICVVVVMVVVS